MLRINWCLCNFIFLRRWLRKWSLIEALCVPPVNTVSRISRTSVNVFLKTWRIFLLDKTTVWLGNNVWKTTSKWNNQNWTTILIRNSKRFKRDRESKYRDEISGFFRSTEQSMLLAASWVENKATPIRLHVRRRDRTHLNQGIVLLTGRIKILGRLGRHATSNSRLFRMRNDDSRTKDVVMRAHRQCNTERGTGFVSCIMRKEALPSTSIPYSRSRARPQALP